MPPPSAEAVLDELITLAATFAERGQRALAETADPALVDRTTRLVCAAASQIVGGDDAEVAVLAAEAADAGLASSGGPRPSVGDLAIATRAAIGALHAARTTSTVAAAGADRDRPSTGDADS